MAQAPADAPLSRREKDMMLLIQSLTERLGAMEKRVQQLEQRAPNPAPAPELEQRVEQIEAALQEQPPPADNDLRVYWEEGIRFDSRDGAFKLRLGGRIQNDYAWFDQDRALQDIDLDGDGEIDIPELEDGTEFRRSRLVLSGQIYENVKFKAQYDFAGGDADFADVYVELTKIPAIGNIRVGQYYEPFGLDQLSSDRYSTFLERNIITEAFSPARNTGAMIYNTALNERMTWAAGVFRDSDTFGDSKADGDYSVTGRVTGLPWYKDEGRRLLHLGAAFSHRNVVDAFRFRARPGAHLAERFVDTGKHAADSADLLGLETALVVGPLFVQGEYMAAEVDTDAFGRESFNGYSVQASYFLTGEHRPYKTTDGVFSRVKPRNNFNIHGENQGWGAWEVAARYSSVDLNDSGVRGGQEDDLTLGLNWYLNPNTRVMLNYVHADIDHDAYKGDVNTLQTRFQVDF